MRAVGAAVAVGVIIENGDTVSNWMDVVSIYIVPLGALLAAIMFFWVCGKEYVEQQINKGREKAVSKILYPACKYLFCPICFVVLIFGIILGGIG